MSSSIFNKHTILLIQSNFIKAVAGYHMINTMPINETMWEEIHSMVFTACNIEILSKSNGSHAPGMDIHSSIGKFSNKSAKYLSKKNNFKISSYRLTTLCDSKNCGNIIDIVNEINNKKNFDYYSFILRRENEKTETIDYDWLIIPSDYQVLNPSSYEWSPTMGKKNNDEQVGWHTNKINGCKMYINFSMSSQLWIHVEMFDEIKQFIVASSSVKNKSTYNYIDLLNKLNI